MDDRWNAFLNALPPEFTENLPMTDDWENYLNNLPKIADAEYCSCGCGVDRMTENCPNGSW